MQPPASAFLCAIDSPCVRASSEKRRRERIQLLLHTQKLCPIDFLLMSGLLVPAENLLCPIDSLLNVRTCSVGKKKQKDLLRVSLPLLNTPKLFA